MYKNSSWGERDLVRWDVEEWGSKTMRYSSNRTIGSYARQVEVGSRLSIGR
jgi:hypothetical protein